MMIAAGVFLIAYLWVAGGLTLARKYREMNGGDIYDFALVFTSWPLLCPVAEAISAYRHCRPIWKKMWSKRPYASPEISAIALEMLKKDRATLIAGGLSPDSFTLEVIDMTIARYEAELRS